MVTIGVPLLGYIVGYLGVGEIRRCWGMEIVFIAHSILH